MGTVRWTRWTAGAGALFAVLLIGSIFVTNTPNPGASPAKIYDYYLNHKTQLHVAGLLTYLAIFVGIWFFASLWRYFRSRRGMEVPAIVSLIGAVLFATSGGIGAGLNFAAADHTRALGPSSVVLLNNLQSDLLFPLIVAGLALIYAAAGIVIHRTHAFGRWLAWVSWVLALAVLVPPVAIIGFFGMPLWVLTVCVLLLRLPAREAEAVAAAHPAPATLVDTQPSPGTVEAKHDQRR